MRATRPTTSLFSLLAPSSCTASQAGPPTTRMASPNTVQAPTGEAAPELVAALEDHSLYAWVPGRGLAVAANIDSGPITQTFD